MRMKVLIEYWPDLKDRITGVVYCRVIDKKKW